MKTAKICYHQKDSAGLKSLDCNFLYNGIILKLHLPWTSQHKL